MIFRRNTWTPALTFGGAAVGMTYGTQVGIWVRLGPIVFMYFRVVLTAKGSSTGAAALSLPVTVLTFTDYRSASDIEAFNMTGGTVGTVGLVVISAGTTANLFKTGGEANVTDADFTNTSVIQGSLMYLGV